jgi:hypothetical protein
VAASYPETPTEEEKQQLLNFFHAMYISLNLVLLFILAKTVLVILVK